MLPRNSDREWEAFGRNDPYYGVLSHERFRKDRLNDDSLKEFFKSGQEHIDFVLATIQTSLDSEFSPSRALDFGCGIGRCSIPLTRVCQSVLGVDVSDSMLQQARKICLEQSISNLELVKSDDTLSGVVGPFDFVHSFLVFQHIPAKRGKKIFSRLIQLLSDNGVASVQFVYHREEPAVVRIMGSLRKKVPVLHNFVNLLYRKPFWEPLIEKNVYDLNQLLAILHQNGCGNLHIRCFGKGKLRSVILFFQKKKDHVPYDAYAYYL
jgi:ubiquinone/menaquinone biosynthesis C-methylase UbiE